MNKVQPIRDQMKIQKLKDYLLEWNEKYYMMWLLGSNLGLRISDILKLRVADINGQDHIVFRESKSGRAHRLPVNRRMQREIRDYVRRNHLRPKDYMIPSRKGDNQPLTRSYAYTVLNTAARECGIKDPIGTHTMRKTFGYWHYRQNRDIALLQQIFGHSAPSITLRYIGIEDDVIDESMDGFFL